MFPFWKYCGLAWRFIITVAALCFFLEKIEFPQLQCQLPKPSAIFLSMVDISEQKRDVEKLSPKALFFGPSDESIPEDLKLKEWDEMEYTEPLFVFP
jgi:hypothetical protein